MAKVSCFVHKNYVEQLISNLGEHNIIHLTELQFDILIKSEVSEFQEKNKEITSLLSRINFIFTNLRLKQQMLKDSNIKWEDTDSLINESKKNIEVIEAKIKEIDKETDALESQQKIAIPRFRLRKTKFKIMRIEIVKEFNEMLQYLLMRLTAKKLIFQVINEMPHTREVYFFEGWVTKERLKEFSKIIKNKSEGMGALIQKNEISTDIKKATKKIGKPPSLIKYPRVTGIFASFAAITKAFGVPDYYEFDPTPFFLITFPVLFGMMYGDVGHGVLLFVITFLIYISRNRFSFNKGSVINYAIDGAPLLMFCSISSIIFGFLYGEMFGSEEWFFQITGIKEAIWFSPMHHPNALLKYSLYAGIIQISFGIIINIWNKISSKQFKDALFGTVPFLIFYFSFSYLLISRGWDFINILYEPITLSLFVILPFAAMITGKLYLEGYLGINKSLEQLLTSFSHTISYARIMALKLIGIAFSKMLLPTNTIGLIPFILGTLLLITIFETMLIFLHTLRLHWIEWFSKFYQGTGIQFQPFILTE